MSNPVRIAFISGTGALVSSQVLKASAGNLQEIVCTNTGASTVYCQVFNSATVPADSTVPAIVFAVPAGTSASYDSQQGVPFSAGISVCVSSTAHVKTLAAAEAVFFALVEG